MELREDEKCRQTEGADCGDRHSSWRKTSPPICLTTCASLRFPEDPPGERRPRASIFGEVIWFLDAHEALSWLEAAWRKHEGLIREGVEGEPHIVKMMQDLRKFIAGGRELPKEQP